MLDTIERFNRRLSGWFEWIALGGTLLVMVITCIDVFGSKILRLPLLGSIDMVQLAQTVAIAFAASMALILGRHIQVEFFVRLLPRRLAAVVNSCITFIGLGLFILLLWRMSLFGYALQNQGDYSATIHIPYYPFAYGIALACIPVCVVYYLEFNKSMREQSTAMNLVVAGIITIILIVSIILFRFPVAFCIVGLIIDWGVFFLDLFLKSKSLKKRKVEQ